MRSAFAWSEDRQLADCLLEFTPAFDKTGCKVVWPSGQPRSHEVWGKEFPMVDLAPGEAERAIMLPAVKPNKLLTGLL